MRTEIEIKEKYNQVSEDLNKYKKLSLENPSNKDFLSDVDSLSRRKVFLEWILGLR